MSRRLDNRKSYFDFRGESGSATPILSNPSPHIWPSLREDY